jgi:putative ABC transport system permease protein
MGFDKEQMLVLDYNYDERVNSRSSALKSELKQILPYFPQHFLEVFREVIFQMPGTSIQNPDGEMIGLGQAIFRWG